MIHSSHKVKMQVLALSLAFSALVAFQNCSKANFLSSNSTATKQGSTGPNGDDPAYGAIIQTLIELQPAMAVRSANCINCHGNTMASSLITDFGYGDTYFFSRNVTGSPNSGDWIYSLRIAADATSATYIPNWAQDQQYTNGASIIVPQVNLGFSYSTYAPTWAPPAAWLSSTTLPDLVTQIENLPGAGNTPVVAKSSIYIGAPSVDELRLAGGIGPGNPLKYYPATAASPALSGIALSNSYYTNTGTLVCDGDLFIDGTVFLNQLTVNTLTGCRLHATGPIFVQMGITYSPKTDTANLQLVSSRLISMGVGDSHCEASTNPAGWYAQTGTASPLAMRLTSMSDPASSQFKAIVTRNTNLASNFQQTSSSPLVEGNALYAMAKQIQGLQDASCHGRAVAFDRLMIVAPLLHSRYNGSFSGLIIGEFPLFSLGTFTYGFDPVFQKVPILPKIPNAEYLVVK